MDYLVIKALLPLSARVKEIKGDQKCCLPVLRLLDLSPVIDYSGDQTRMKLGWLELQLYYEEC